MSYKLYFLDSAVQITNTDATFGERRFNMAEIGSARIQAEWDRLEKNWVWWLALTVTVLGVTGKLITNFVPRELGKIYLDMVAFLFIVVAAVLWYFLLAQLNVRYIIIISSSFGEATVVVARHLRYAKTIVKAIKAAKKAQNTSSLEKGQAAG